MAKPKAQLEPAEAGDLSPPKAPAGPKGPPPAITELGEVMTAPDPDTEVTQQNVDAIENFLRHRGFYNGQPDETSDYFDLYTQVQVVRGALKPHAPKAARARSSTNRPDVLEGRLGRLISAPDIELHTFAAVLMFKGRKGEPAKGIAPIPSFYLCANRLSQAVALSNAGNPFADWHLLLVWSFLERNEAALQEALLDCEKKRAEREKTVGRSIPWNSTDQTVKPSDRVTLGTMYSLKLLDVLTMMDRLTVRYLSLHDNGILVPRSAMIDRLDKLQHAWRQFCAFIVVGWDRFLAREDVRGITRENSPPAWPVGYEKFCIQHFRRETVSTEIWERTKVLPHH